MTQSDTILIVNTEARTASDIETELKEYCTQHAIKNLFVPAAEIQETILNHQHCSKIIIGGGDGTICNAAKLLLHSPAIMGIIPLGTSNNIAKGLNIPTNWQEALEGAISWPASAIPVGKANGKIFMNTATIGVSVTIAKHVESGSKKILGRLAYPWTALRFMRKHKPLFYEMEYENKQVTGASYQLIISNGRYVAGLPLYNKEDDFTDFLRVMSFNAKRRKISNMIHMGAMLLGIKRKHPSILLKQVTQITIATQPIHSVELDGEVQTKTPVEFTIETNALQVALPIASDV